MGCRIPVVSRRIIISIFPPSSRSPYSHLTCTMISSWWEKPFSIWMRKTHHQSLKRFWTSFRTCRSYCRSFHHTATILCSTLFRTCKSKHAAGWQILVTLDVSLFGFIYFLPFGFYIGRLFFFRRVSENYDNKMCPSNLGIVFGPTLLRPIVSADMSMVALLETSYQAVLVEFLITHYNKIFGVEERLSTPPPPAPTAPLPDTPPRASCPMDGVDDADLEHDTSRKERPHSYSLEVSI